MWRRRVAPRATACSALVRVPAARSRLCVIAAQMAQAALAAGRELAAVCQMLGVSEQTYYRWRNQFGGLKADDAKRLKELERENATLKRLLADAELEKAALKEIARGNF